MLVSSLLVDEEDFDIDSQRMASRDSGAVFKGTLKNTSPPMRVAVWAASPGGVEAHWQASLKDAVALANTKHPGILSPVGFCIETMGRTRYLKYVLTPFMENGSVHSHAEKEHLGEADPRWDATRKSMCVFGIAATMAHMHSLGILHGHLKLQNVFLNEQFEPVISEAGLRKPIPYIPNPHWGGLLYTVPDQLEAPYGGRHSHTAAGDVYTYGICVLYLLMQLDWFWKGSFTSRFCLWKMIESGEILHKVPREYIPEFHWELIEACCDLRPENRPTFSEIVQRLRENTEKYALPGTDLDVLREYEHRILEGFEV